MIPLEVIFIFIILITYIFFQLKFNKNNFILHKIKFLNNSSDYQQNENINFISIIFFYFFY